MKSILSHSSLLVILASLVLFLASSPTPVSAVRVRYHSPRSTSTNNDSDDGRIPFYNGFLRKGGDEASTADKLSGSKDTPDMASTLKDLPKVKVVLPPSEELPSKVSFGLSTESKVTLRPAKAIATEPDLVKEA